MKIFQSKCAHVLMPILHKIQSTLTTSMTFARKEFSSRFDLNCFLGFRCSDILYTDKQRNARSDRLLNVYYRFGYAKLISINGLKIYIN